VLGTASALLFFKNPEAAAEAKKLQFMVIRNKEMLVSYFDMDKVKNKKGNVFVKGLPPEATNKTLHDIFEGWGEVFSSRLAQDMEGRSKGYGYVQYMYHRIGEVLLKNRYQVTAIYPSLKISGYEERTNATFYTNIYIKNLPSNITTKDQLEELFTSFGKITSSAIFPRSMGNRINYFGFVNFENTADAKEAVSKMHGKEVNNSVLFVRKALNKEQRLREKRQQLLDFKKKRRCCSLFIREKDGGRLDESQVRVLFPGFNIKGIHIRKHWADGKLVNESVGIITFETEKDAHLARMEDHGPLIISKLESKEERRIRMYKERYKGVYFVY